MASIRRLSAFTAALVCVVATLLTQPASACLAPPPEPPGIRISTIGVNRASIDIFGYQTFPSGGSNFCACALNQVEPVVSIDFAQVTDAVTGRPLLCPGGPSWLPCFPFVPDAHIGEQFSDLTGDPFQGFFADLVANVPAGREVNLKFVVTTKDGVTLAELADAFAQVPAIVGNDEVTADGDLMMGDHFGLLPPGDINIQPPLGGGQQCYKWVAFCDGIQIDAIAPNGDITAQWYHYDCANNTPMSGFTGGSFGDLCPGGSTATLLECLASEGCNVGGSDWHFNLDTPIDGTLDMANGTYPGGTCWIDELAYTRTLGPCTGLATNGDRETPRTASWE